MAQSRPATPINLTPPPPEQPTGMSPGTRQAIAIVALVICLLVGVGIIYWFLHGPTRRSLTVDPKEQTADMSGRPLVRMPPRRAPQAIVKDDDTTWTVTGGSGTMRVKSVNGGYKVRVHYNGRDMLAHDQTVLISGVVRATSDEAMAKEWGVTPDQVAQLKKIDIRGGMHISKDEGTELETLWTAYMNAADGSAKTDAEKKLIARMDEITKAELDTTRKEIASKIDDYKKILTPEQLEKITQR